MNSTHTWSCWQDFICGKNGLQCVFLATFFSLAVLRIASGYKYISNKVYHSRLYTLYLFPDMTTHGSRLLPRPRPGQDGMRSMFNSRQSFVDCVSAGAERYYLCLQWPGEAAAAARRGPLLTADLLNTAEMASIVTILPPIVLTFKILEEKDFGPNYFDSKKKSVCK